MTDPAVDHILILWYPANIRTEEDREVREVFGPLTKQGADDLGDTLHRLTGVPYEVVPIKPVPLTLTNTGRQEATRHRT